MFRFVLLALLSLVSVANAESRRLYVDIPSENGATTTGKGTAFCIGVTETGNSIWATARHNFDESTNAVVLNKEGHAYPVLRDSIRKHPNPYTDVAIFESTIPVKGHWLLANGEPGQLAIVPGYGPEYHGRTAVAFAGRILDSNFMMGEQSYHAITGDSGAPLVVGGDYVVGVLSGHESPERKTSHRADYQHLNLKTVYVEAKHVKYLLDQHYQYQQRCTPQGCYIYGAPTVVQPRMGITVPVGPPRVVGVTQPQPIYSPPRNEQRPQPLYPQPKEQPTSTAPDNIVLQKLVSEWMERNADRLRGPAGKDGRDGKDGSNEVLAQEQLPLQVILARDGKIIQEKIIPPGKPLILDVSAFEGPSPKSEVEARGW